MDFFNQFSNMTTIEIVANILSATGMLFIATSTIFKNKKGILIFQSINQILSGIAFVLLKAYSGLAMSIATLIINGFALFNKQNKKLNIFFIILILLLGASGIVIDNVTAKTAIPLYLNLISLLPIICNVEYNLIVLTSKESTVLIRIGFLVSCLLWAIYSYFYKNYSGIVFNILAIIINIISAIRMKNKLKIEASELINKNNVEEDIEE